VGDLLASIRALKKDDSGNATGGLKKVAAREPLSLEDTPPKKAEEKPKGGKAPPKKPPPPPGSLAAKQAMLAGLFG
jgi:hypothetical protein